MKKITSQEILIRTQRSKGFTLIELLIVIAIIGVLAATVIVSLGSQTDKATLGSVMSSVSSLRTMAMAHTLDGLTGTGLCDEIYKNMSGEKDGWTWDGKGTRCRHDTLVGASGLQVGKEAGEICCHANSSGKWVIWSALPTADGTANSGKDIYCADSKGFLGDLAANASNNTGRVPHVRGSDSECKNG